MSNAAPSTSSLPEQPDKPHWGQLYQQLPGEAFRCFPWHCGHGWQALHAHCTVAEAFPPEEDSCRGPQQS